MTNLIEIRDRLLTAPGLATTMRSVIETIGNKRRPLGKLNPWAWWVELVRGLIERRNYNRRIFSHKEDK
jgi:hypothetical protein